MLGEYEDAILDGIIAQLSEHFPNYAIAVLSEEEGGSLHYDYNNFRIGRMLFRDSLEDMGNELEMSNEMVAWDDWDDDEDYE